MEGHDRLLMQTEVARLFRVDSRTVRRWADRGWIIRVRTPGGHPRYRESQVRELLSRPVNDRPGIPLPPDAGPVPT